MPEHTYEDAERRVNETPELEPYRDIILYNWDEATHWEWVCTAPVAEIVSWVGAVERA